jgi:hypothetical protein
MFSEEEFLPFAKEYSFLTGGYRNFVDPLNLCSGYAKLGSFPLNAFFDLLERLCPHDKANLSKAVLMEFYL